MRKQNKTNKKNRDKKQILVLMAFFFSAAICEMKQLRNKKMMNETNNMKNEMKRKDETNKLKDETYKYQNEVK